VINKYFDNFIKLGQEIKDREMFNFSIFKFGRIKKRPIYSESQILNSKDIIPGKYLINDKETKSNRAIIIIGPVFQDEKGKSKFHFKFLGGSKVLECYLEDVGVIPYEDGMWHISHYLTPDK
jgi:hypothetical protein